MLTFLCEIHFWTLKNDVAVCHTDLGHFKYNEKKETETSIDKIIKQNYVKARGNNWSLSNKRPLKLKDSLKCFETELHEHNLIAAEWVKKDKIAFVLGNGSTIFVAFDPVTCDLIEIVFDKFLQTKFQCEQLINVSYAKQILMCSFSDHKLGVVHFGRPLDCASNKWSFLEPKVGLFDFSNSSMNRKNERKITFNVSATMVATWTKSSLNEVYPWNPLVKDEHRANVHVYKIIGPRLELSCYYHTKQDPLIVSFSKTISNILFILEQKNCNDPKIYFSTFEVTNSKLHLINVVTIGPFEWCSASITNAWLNKDDSRLCFSYNDSVLFVYDFKLTITYSVKTAFPVEHLDWHPDGNLIAVSDTSGRVQCYDSCLSSIRLRSLTEDTTISSAWLDVQSKVGNKKLFYIKWMPYETAKHPVNHSDAILLLVFNGGPIVAIKVLGIGKLCVNHLVSMYLNENDVDHALNVLLGLDWHSDGPLCLTALQQITNYLFRLPFTPIREVQLQSAIGSFYQPVVPLSKDSKYEYSEPVQNVARRFFHHLVRYKLYEKAYSLAIDLNDRDLFMDLYWATKSGIGTRAMATMALEKANQIVSSESDESHSSQSSNCDCTEYHSTSSPRPPLPSAPVTLSSPSLSSSVSSAPNNKSQNNVTTISVPYTSARVEPVHTKKLELPTTSLESVPHIKYPFEQQLLGQNTRSENNNLPSSSLSTKPHPDKTIKVVHFGIV